MSQVGCQRKFIPSLPPNSDVLPDGFFVRLKKRIHSRRIPLSRGGQFGMFLIYTSIPLFIGWATYSYTTSHQQVTRAILEKKGLGVKDKEKAEREFHKQVEWIFKEAKSDRPIGTFGPYQANNDK